MKLFDPAIFDPFSFDTEDDNLVEDNLRYTVKVNNVDLPKEDVLSISQSERTFEFIGQNLISTKIEITLGNIDYKYDDRQGTSGYFEDIVWYNYIVEVYDNFTNLRIWLGRLKAIGVNDSDRTVILTSSDFVQDMADSICVISKENKMASEIIYSIITEVLLIDESYIIQAGFDEALTLQDGETLDIDYNAANNISCISVIEELCRISDSYLYQQSNLIAYWQWREYNGNLGYSIKNRDLTPGSYSHIASEENHDIFNSFSIIYDSSGTAIFATGEDEDSQDKYGTNKIFNMPNEFVDSTSSSDYKIIFTSESGALSAGNRILNHYKEIKKYVEFTIGDQFNFFILGDLIDMRFSPYVREPIIIISIEENEEERTLLIKGECANYPEDISLDLTPPDAIELIQIIQQYNQDIAWVFFSSSSESDFLRYILYFTSSNGSWYDESITGGISPLNIFSTQVVDYKGDIVYLLNGIETDIPFWYRISCEDTSYNESDFSDVKQKDETKLVHISRFTGTYNADDLIKLNDKFVDMSEDQSVIDVVYGKIYGSGYEYIEDLELGVDYALEIVGSDYYIRFLIEQSMTGQEGIDFYCIIENSN